MSIALSPLEQRLLDGWQRDLPLTPRPFAVIAKTLGSDEASVLDMLAKLRRAGAIARVGATCRPNTAGASTLAAMAAPEDRIEAVAGTVCAEPGVNHAYRRENHWNLWFVVTGPDRGHVDATLARIHARTGLRVLDLPLVRAFNVDLGFALNGPRRAATGQAAVDRAALRPGDKLLMQELSEGLALAPRPYEDLAARLERTEADVIGRIAALLQARLLSRLGIIVRHRALGFRANAMVVWRLAEDQIEAAGRALMRHPGVTLCYQRRPAPDVWPYSLYCMIHARGRAEALDILSGAAALDELAGAAHATLFSTQCFKQTGALIHARVSEATA